MPSESSGDYKMVLVVRGEIRLTPGKAAVQVAHAAVMLVREADRRQRAAVEAWEAGGQKKIALRVETLAEMEALQRAARAAHIPCVVVEDAGLTEVAPGTRTVLGLGPARSADLDRITGALDLL